MPVSMFVVLIQHIPSSIRVCICVCVYCTGAGAYVCMSETQPSVVCVCAPQHAECRCKGTVKCHVKLRGIDWNSASSMEKHVAVGRY